MQIGDQFKDLGSEKFDFALCSNHSRLRGWESPLVQCAPWCTEFCHDWSYPRSILGWPKYVLMRMEKTCIVIAGVWKVLAWVENGFLKSESRWFKTVPDRNLRLMCRCCCVDRTRWFFYPIWLVSQLRFTVTAPLAFCFQSLTRCLISSLRCLPLFIYGVRLGRFQTGAQLAVTNIPSSHQWLSHYSICSLTQEA